MPKTQPASLALLDKVFDIALEFGGAWRLPVAVHLLALLPYGLDPREVYERLSIRLNPTSEQMYAFLYKWKITRLIDDEYDRCATYWQTIHAPQVMSELTRGQSIMKALFLMNVRRGQPLTLSYTTNNLISAIGLLIQARTVLNSTMRVVSQYSDEYSAIADTVRRSTGILLAEENRLGAMLA